MMKHVMIDLETLGTKVDSVFLSVAAVQFDLDSGVIGSKFMKNVSVESALAAGRRIDGSTLKWWLDQKPEIMKKMFDNPSDLSTVLVELHTWWDQHELMYPWGNSASFDIGILNHAYDGAYLPTPWKYRNERCYRTLVSMFPGVDRVSKPLDAHDPVVDCVFQIQKLCNLWKVLGKTGQ